MLYAQVDDCAEPTCSEKETLTSYVQYRLNQHVQNEKSTKLWKRAETRDIFEFQEWRCAAFGRFFSATMVSGNGMLPSGDRMPCTYMASTCDKRYLAASRAYHSRVRRLLV
jgi:hypothetical protein